MFEEIIQMNKKFIRILTAFTVIVLILNLILLATSRISELLFWIIVALIALFAYVILPRLKYHAK